MPTCGTAPALAFGATTTRTFPRPRRRPFAALWSGTPLLAGMSGGSPSGSRTSDQSHRDVTGKSAGRRCRRRQAYRGIRTRFFRPLHPHRGRGRHRRLLAICIGKKSSRRRSAPHRHRRLAQPGLTATHVNEFPPALLPGASQASLRHRRHATPRRHSMTMAGLYVCPRRRSRCLHMHLGCCSSLVLLITCSLQSQQEPTPAAATALTMVSMSRSGSDWAGAKGWLVQATQNRMLPILQSLCMLLNTRSDEPRRQRLCHLWRRRPLLLS